MCCTYENYGHVAIKVVIGEVEKWTPRNRLKQLAALWRNISYSLNNESVKRWVSLFLLIAWES